MNWIITIYIALLFFVLSPGVLLRIPRKGKPMVVAAVHAVVFSLIWHFTGKMVWKASVSMGAGKTEGFREGLTPTAQIDADFKKAGGTCNPTPWAQTCGSSSGCTRPSDNKKYTCDDTTKKWTVVA
jgi:hypothetical protein